MYYLGSKTISASEMKALLLENGIDVHRPKAAKLLETVTLPSGDIDVKQVFDVSVCMLLVVF